MSAFTCHDCEATIVEGFLGADGVIRCEACSGGAGTPIRHGRRSPDPAGAGDARRLVIRSMDDLVAAHTAGDVVYPDTKAIAARLAAGEVVEIDVFEPTSEPGGVERCHDCYFCGNAVPASKAVAVDTPEGIRPWVTACPSCADRHSRGELAGDSFDEVHHAD